MKSEERLMDLIDNYAVKPEEKLLDLMGILPEEMLGEALHTEKVYKYRKNGVFYGIVAAACLIVLFIWFTPAGQVMAAGMKENIVRLLEELFPPKEIPMTIEGMEENVPHNIYGELPTEAASENKTNDESTVDKAGFSIYVDTDSFETTEDGAAYIIRGKRINYTREDAIRDNGALLDNLSEAEAEEKIREIMERMRTFYDNFPTGEIRILQKPNISIGEASAEMKKEVSGQYANVSDISVCELPKGLYLRADEGTDSSSKVKEIYIIDNGLGGVFIITASYTVEATEGMGTRLRSMIETFQVLDSTNGAVIQHFEEQGNSTTEDLDSASAAALQHFEDQGDTATEDLGSASAKALQQPKDKPSLPDINLRLNAALEKYRNISYGEYLKQGGQPAELYHADRFFAPLNEEGLEIIFTGIYDEESAGMILAENAASIRLQGNLGNMINGLPEELSVDDFVNGLIKTYGETTDIPYPERGGTAYYVGTDFVRILLDTDGDSVLDTALEISLDVSKTITSASLAWLCWI